MYLYSIWDKNQRGQQPDISMRNIEYTLYFIYTIYIFKFLESIYKLSTYGDFANDLMPETFFPVGLTLVFLHLLLLIVTLITFRFRKSKFGAFDLHDNLDNWK